jgi:hypothetical protein
VQLVQYDGEVQNWQLAGQLTHELPPTYVPLGHICQHLFAYKYELATQLKQYVELRQVRQLFMQSTQLVVLPLYVPLGQVR